MYRLKQNEALSARAESTHKGVNLHPKDFTQTQQQRPESPTVTLTWHASKYQGHKLHQRTHNSKNLSHLWELSPGMWVHTRYINTRGHTMAMGAGIAQWLEHRTRDWKVAGSNPCWNGGRIFFSRVDFLCWLLFRYPFHPRVTTVARKKSRSFCQKCRWQVTAKHAYTLRMWILLNRASALVTTCP